MVAPPASETIAQRFAQLIQQFGLTKNSFAVSLGKTASVVQHLIDGRNKPGYDLLCKVFEIYPNVSRDWLLLGRGPMLVGGEPTSKQVPRPVPATSELPLEPIDLSDIEAPNTRRPGPGLAGTRLQPSEIAATLALASAAQHPARAAAPTLNGFAPVHEETNPPITSERSAASQSQAAPAPVTNRPAAATIAPSPTSASAANPGPGAPVISAPAANPEAYIAAALHAQHLQHQLALAEIKNQHLLEQQQMLREMLAMARQAMV